MKKSGLLLVNLGTPDKPEAPEVGRYLEEFLMDPYVIDLPFPMRWALVHGIILRTRPKASAALYQNIWTERGSPLLYHLQDLATQLRPRLEPQGLQVEAGMRYGNPSLRDGLKRLSDGGVEEAWILPLYPQYSEATTRSTIEECVRIRKQSFPGLSLRFIPPFYRAHSFIEAFAKVSGDFLTASGPIGKQEDEFYLFSYHGLPERQVKKADPSRAHCLEGASCCDTLSERNKDCYRAQCFHTTAAIASRLGLPKERTATAFQSRLGRTPWIRPYTDEFYERLPSRGIRKLTVFCPSFVADCLETLEEIQLRGQEAFRHHGGESLRLVPSLNSSAVWAEALSRLVLSKVLCAS